MDAPSLRAGTGPIMSSMIEVYTGARPGRPRLLLMLTAGLLAAVCGTAWWQVRDARRLAPERKVGDLPLYVRPPRDWVLLPGDQQTYGLPVARDHWGRPATTLRRAIRYHYHRLPVFVSPDVLLSKLNGPNDRILSQEPAPIGGYPGVQVRLVSRGERDVRERLIRLACLPRGEVIEVEYTPLGELSPGDFELMDDVCAAVRLDVPGATASAAAAEARAGVQLTGAAGDWRFALPDLAAVPGLYVSGEDVDGGQWTVSLFRTWLAAGRTPNDLLRDFASEFWLMWDVGSLVEQVSRPDGATVATLRYPVAQGGNERIIAASVVSAPGGAAILFAFGAIAQPKAAWDAADRIARMVELGPLAGAPPVDETFDAGRKLCEKLAQRGALPRWGREPVRLVFSGRTGRGAEHRMIERRALAHDPELGYHGDEVNELLERNRREASEWQIDGHADGYTQRSDLFTASEPAQVRETRETNSSQVTRTLSIDGRRRTFHFDAPPNFVPPPVVDILYAWVARGETGPALLQVSTTFGAGWHTELVRALPPDGAMPRALVQADFYPLGMTFTFDEKAAEVQRFEYATGGSFERVER